MQKSKILESCDKVGNTTDIEEKVEMASNQADETLQETYHILAFVKEHTSAFVAILSGMVAVAAFVLNLVAYVYQRIRLNPWHISGDVIEFWGNRQFLLPFILELIYAVLLYVVPVMLARSFIYYHRLIGTLKYGNAWIKSLQAKQKQAHKEAKGIKKTLKKIKVKSVKESSVRLQRIEASLENAKKELRTIKRTLWLTRGLAILYIGIICLLVALLFIPVIILMIGITGEINWKVLSLFWGIAAIWIVIAAKNKAKQMDKVCTPKAVRQNIKEIVSGNDVHQRLSDRTKVMHEKSKEKTAVIKALNDETIKELGIKALIAMVATMLFFCTSVTDTAYKQTEFWIYSDSTNTYAVAYQDADHCVLKRASIDDGEIIIHTGEQLVVSGTVATSQRIFDKVTFEEVTSQK